MLKISNDSKKKIQKYITLFNKLPDIKTKKALKVFVYDYGISTLSYILDMKDTLAANQIELGHPLIFNIESIDEINQNLIIRQRSDMMVNGKDILESLNQKGGPWLKDVLRNIECAIINQEIPNQKSEIINWVKTHVEQQLFALIQILVDCHIIFVRHLDYISTCVFTQFMISLF